LYTAASSEVSMPTSNCEGTGKPGLCFNMLDSTPGAILQPQPPPCEKEVSRIGAFMMKYFTKITMENYRAFETAHYK